MVIKMPRDSDVKDHLPLSPLWFQVLIALLDGEQHGYGIIKEIEARQGQPGRLATGPIYLALQRMQERGFVRPAGTERTDAGPQRRLYRLTPLGRRVAAAEAERVAAVLSAAMDRDLVDRRTLSRLLDHRE